MEKREKYYKEIIKSRMFKTASNIWGVRNIDSFDPLIRLMIEALASEMNKLSHELTNIETRLLERLSALLTPDILMTNRPAHMIVHAMPMEEQNTLHKRSGFSYEGPKKDYRLNFYPATDFTLINAGVRSLICGRNFYRMDETLNKELAGRSLRRDELFSNSVWIGLDIHHSLPKIKNVSFYFDILNIENKNNYLNLLPYTQWKLNGQPLDISWGIYKDENKADEGYKPFRSYDLAYISDNKTVMNYNHQYITVTSEIINNKNNRQTLPAELENQFPPQVTEENIQKLHWIKISFPANFEEFILDNIFVCINAFPVINKKFHEMCFKPQQSITSIIPLETKNNEYFLSVESVTDTRNNEYMPLPFSDDENNRYKTYIVKTGGAERFDSRNGKEFVSYMLDLLREENAAFSLMGRDFNTTLFKSLEEQLTAIEKYLRYVSSNDNISSYLIIDAEETDESIFIEYWTTNCEEGNEVKAGSELFSHTTTYVMPNSAISLTQSRGGIRSNKRKALDTYKYILASRDRIYTKEDIRNFCLSEFGEIINSAMIKRGVELSNKPKEGLVRTIDIFINIKNQLAQFSSQEEFQQNLLANLKERSPENYNYRIFINQS